jgi:hypothetical protein
VYQKLPDGRILFKNVEERPPIPHGYSLPSAPTKEELKARESEEYMLSTEGYTPIASGPVIDLTIDGEDWSKKINESLKEAGLDAMPKAPFVLLVVGSIAAGKTSMLKKLLDALVHKDRFSHVVIGSKSLGLDPILKEHQLFRDPSVKFEIKKRVGATDFEEQYKKVEQYFAPWNKLATEGLFKKRPVVDNPEWHKRFFMKTHIDGDLHPFLDRNGNFHGMEPVVKDWSDQRSAVSRFKNRALFNQETHMLQEHVPMKEEVHSAYVQGENLHRQERVLNALLSYPDTATRTAQMAKLEAMIGNPAVARAHEPPAPVLYVFEDAAFATKQSDSMTLQEWLTIIRHIRGSCVILVQQKSSAARIYRTIATDVYIFGTKNQQELDSIEEEYGSTVTNFKRKYYAATHAIDKIGEKDFLNIPLRERDKCYRSHHGEIVPVNKPSVVEDEDKAGVKHPAEEENDKTKRKKKE